MIPLSDALVKNNNNNNKQHKTKKNEEVLDGRI